MWEIDQGQYDREEYVFSACGGSAAYRRSMLDQIGLLDEDFFYSCEDVDLAWRAQLAGWRCVYAPNAVVYHKLKATGGGATASFYDGRNFIYADRQKLSVVVVEDLSGRNHSQTMVASSRKPRGRGAAKPLVPACVA